jgi:hypothetical protein
MPSERLRNERRAQGLCRCGKPFAANRKMCEECRKRMTETNKQLRAVRREGGLCRCGKPVKAGRKMCGACGAKHVKEVSEAYRRNIEAGLCGCGQPRVEGCSKCERCKPRFKRATAIKRQKGICYRCTKPAREGGVLCGTCLAYGARQGAYTTIHRKKAVMDHYGGKCVCCGEMAIEFLSIDHVNNDGAEHRKTVLGQGRIYPWLVQQGFPSGFQVLCMNCNTAKGFYGECPHERARREQEESAAR